MSRYLLRTTPGVVLAALLGALSGGNQPLAWALVFALTAMALLLLRWLA